MAGTDHHPCARCTAARRKLGAELGDLNDIKRKLFKHGSTFKDHHEGADYRQQALRIKERVERARLDLETHEAECEVAIAREAASRATGRVDLPVEELLHLRAEGATIVELATKYGGSKAIVKRNLDEATPAEAVEEPDLTWQDQALCAETDPEAFFPEKGGSTREAKKVCLTCEVRDDCLKYALANDERFGIWGGLSERERRKLKRKQAAQQTPDEDTEEAS